MTQELKLDWEDTSLHSKTFQTPVVVKNTNNLVGKPDTTEDITSPPEETIAKEHGVK